MVLLVRYRAVSNNLPPAQHLANGEETDDLSADNTNGCPLCAGHVADSVQGADGLLAGLEGGLLGGLEDGAGADLAEEVLEVGLERGDVTTG